jgi:hypothetical protein
MPRFYLHLRQGDALVEDPDGEELVSVAEARDAAKAAAREIMSDQIRRGELPERNSCFEITDNDGHLVLTLPFDEALSPRS